MKSKEILSETSKGKSKKNPTTTHKTQSSIKTKKSVSSTKKLMTPSPSKLPAVKSEIPKKSNVSKTTKITPDTNRSKSSPLIVIESSTKSPGKDVIDDKLEGSNVGPTMSALQASNKPVVPTISTTRYAELVKKADRAIKEGKTFVLRHRLYYIRSAFLERGWIELTGSRLKQKPNGHRFYTYEKLMASLPKKTAVETHSNYIKRCEAHVLSCLIEHAPVAFIWAFKRDNFDIGCNRANPSITLNKFPSIPFVTKGGILRQFKNLNWIWQPGVAEVHFPRSYVASSSRETDAFVDDFRNTACVSFLKYAVERSKAAGWPTVFQVEAEIPFKSFEFALRHCYLLLNSLHNNDIDLSFPNLSSQQEWNDFYVHHQLLTSKDAKIQIEARDIVPILRNVTIILDTIKSHWPQYGIDGYRNLWIIKPSLQNCGRGIVIMSSLPKILSFVSKANRHDPTIVQKYIERPFLIHNTKFDIRQWFLMTSVRPLVIWMYTENYLRFSSQVFDLSSLHESIHITNFCIQRKYAVNAKRDPRLPKMNMWDSHTFNAYLRQNGHPEVYYKRIYPAIKKAIIATLLASQNNIPDAKNSYELFGADFVLGEDFTPWLLEINSCPDLARSTNVTARLVPKLIQDILKVVVDYKNNPKSSVGNFEMIYHQAWPTSKVKSGSQLHIKVEEIPSRYNKQTNPEENFLGEVNNFQIKGKPLPSVEIIKREMYNHLLKASEAKPGNRLQSTTTSSKSSKARIEKEYSAHDKLSTLLHFNDTGRVGSDMGTAEKIEEIAKILQNLKVDRQS